MKVQITQHHIDNGKPRVSDTCPFALAVKDLVKPNTHVDVGLVCLCIGTEHHLIKMSKNLQRFIINFDDGKKVKPRVEDIGIPNKYLKKGSKS